MLVTVSTVKDTLANVQRFVRGNLAGGIDHMIVFLDAHDAEVEEWLADQPEVTWVLTDKSWWQGQRPKYLNSRQRVNANLARSLLCLNDWAEWLFHIDADEIAQLDREAIARVPAEQRAIRLTPLEVISQMHWDREPDWFKPVLGEGDLQLLQSLGALREPRNSLYFRSHATGKAGIRPSLDNWLSIHRATDIDDVSFEHAKDPGFRLLHLESYSGEEFVRKWTTMLGSGPSVNFGPDRLVLAEGLRALLAKDLPQEVLGRYLTQIYRDHMEDPFELLRELGLLQNIDPLGGTHRPEQLSSAQRDQLVAMLEDLRHHDKRQFHRKNPEVQQVPQTLSAIARAHGMRAPTGVQAAGQSGRGVGVRHWLRRGEKAQDTPKS